MAYKMMSSGLLHVAHCDLRGGLESFKIQLLQDQNIDLRSRCIYWPFYRDTLNATDFLGTIFILYANN
jgi:hypothetical protein